MKPAEIPRAEYPRPQFKRDPWVNLNGRWTFSFDFGRSGVQRGLAFSHGFADEILVPFCPESTLSGVHYPDFIEAMWYHRALNIPQEWGERRVILHFGGVDYESEVFIDGRSAGRHWGASSFSLDISAFVSPGSRHDLVVHVQDNIRLGTQPGGKQSVDFASAGCFYTRVTGIWQTVWMEAVSPLALESCHIVPDLDDGAVLLTPMFHGVQRYCRFHVTAVDGEAIVGEADYPALSGLPCGIKINNPKPWEPGHPHLYDLILDVVDEHGTIVDHVKSYTGLRKIHIEGNELYLNNEPLYLRMVLDQGYYPDGVWTAPSDEALRRDIELAMNTGFNGARLHQKVFEQRFHYWADQLGYLTWAESPSWGLDLKSDVAARNFLSEWREIVLRDRSHPSIIAWTPLNETWDISDPRRHKRLHTDAYDLTRGLDATRPVNEASGGCHVKTDLYTVHIYEQNPLLFAEKLRPRENGEVFQTLGEKEARYAGQPYLVDEFGGIKWIADERREVQRSWGYGDAPGTLEDFYARLEGQVNALLSLPHIRGYCYTQLTDVEQEQNGLYHYDRSEKLEVSRLRAIFSRVAAPARASARV